MTDSNGPRWRTQAGIGAALLGIAAVLWWDATRLPDGVAVGVGPAAAVRLVSALVALLGVIHLVGAVRRRARLAATGAVEPPPDRGNRASLAWVLGALVGLIALLQVGAGFVPASAWLFVGTARGFGQRMTVASVAIGVGLSLAVYLFFSKVLSLGLPAGPLERLLA